LAPYTLNVNGSANITGNTYIGNTLVNELLYNQTIATYNQYGQWWYNQSLNVPANSVNIEYKNITNLPTCNAGEHLFYDGSSLTCTADTGFDNTNIAYLNNSVQTWYGVQNFSRDIYLSNGSKIASETTGTNITIDSTGNVVIVLG